MAYHESLFGFGFLAAFAAFWLLIVVGLYVYMALVFMTIARKLKYDKPWLAWIPIANAFLLPILAGKPWPWGFIFFIPIVGFIFYIIWVWKIYEKRGYPGSLSLIVLAALIPFVNFIAAIAHLVVLGVVAWVDRK